MVLPGSKEDDKKTTCKIIFRLTVFLAGYEYSCKESILGKL